MCKYNILLKNGTVVEAETDWLGISSIHGYLCDCNPFILIGEKSFAKDAIAMIEEIETTEKEN